MNDNAITHVSPDDLTGAQAIWLAKRARYRRYKTSWLLHRDHSKVLVVVGNSDGTYLLFAVTRDGRAHPPNGLQVERDV